MKRAIVAAALLAFARPAGAEGVRIGNWPAVQPVNGSVSITNQPSIQPVSGSVSITSMPTQTTGAYMSTSVAISSTSVSVATANPNRKGLLLFNNSTTTVYIAYDTSATTAHLTFAIPTLTTWTMPSPIYLGVLSAVRASTGDGKLLVTELM